MIISNLPIFNLKRGVHVNEFSSLVELDNVLGKGKALQFANEWARMLLRKKAVTIIANEVEMQSIVTRRENEDPYEFIKRWLSTMSKEHGKEVLQNVCDVIKPLSLSPERALPSRPNKQMIERAKAILDNQNTEKWLLVFKEEGIEALTLTGNRENDVMILAGGLKRLNDKQIEREFV